jgi:PrtD family type I secretion system ABC transporter
VLAQRETLKLNHIAHFAQVFHIDRAISGASDANGRYWASSVPECRGDGSSALSSRPYLGSPTVQADPVREAVEANSRLFGTVLVFSAVMSILALTVSFYMLEVYDRVLTSRSIATLLLLTLIATAAIAVFSALDSLRLRLLVRAGMATAAVLSPQVLRAMVTLSARNTANATVKQGLRDVETMRNFIGSPGLAALFDSPFLLVFLIVLFYLHWAYFVLVLVGGAVLACITTIDQMLTSRSLGKSITLSIRAYNFAEDGIRNADVLEGNGMSSTFVGRWREIWVDSLKTALASSDKDTLLMGISKAVRLFIQIALLGLGALLVLDFHSSGGVMIAASILGARALAPIETTVSIWKSIVAVRLAKNRVVELLARAPRRDEGMRLPAPVGHLLVERAGYAIPGAARPILANVSFELAAGESLGVIGPSASGKSTLVRLLIGAWPCMAGSVRLDGADIFAWPRAELSPFIGYLPQDVELFAGTVRENIARLAQGEPETVVAAAQLAGAHEMILSLPNGYDTEIGEAGHKLSGGQRQRIGIARALYGEPRFVALDEPNSNLDGAGEEALVTTLAELKRRAVTVVIVAHRPSVLGSVDKLLALRDGTVESFGPRTEVIQKYLARPARPATNVVTLTPDQGTRG